MYSGRRGGEDYVEAEERSSLNFYSDNPDYNKSGPNDLDRVLYHDLVQIVPLVQSLIDRNNSSSFTRRGSMIFTKTPSRDKKNGKNGVKSKHADKVLDKYPKNDTDGSPDDNSVSSENLAAEKEELKSLREQQEGLRRQLSEKDELLQAAEKSKNQINLIQSQVNELKQFAAERDSLVKSSQAQLNDAKIKLADKQAAVEKLQWEVRTSTQKAESLQEELDSMQLEISSLMHIFEDLSKDDAATPTEDYDILPYTVHHLPEIDNIDEIEILKMEEAKEAYVAAVAIAKKKQDEESLLASATARRHLQSFVFRTNNES